MANIMVQGTTSDAGKTFLAALLCRIFADAGYTVSPFKSQNMSTRYFLLDDDLKISDAQALQAIACKVRPTVDMNPILLLPTSDKKSLLYFRGELLGPMEANEYVNNKGSFYNKISSIYHEVEENNEIVVLEGAGSPAEINLNKDDFMNMGLAKIADAPVLLVADIDRGGVFASLYGTLALLNDEERKRVKGLIINKFRGDYALLSDGIEMFKAYSDIPIIGTLPYMNIGLTKEEKASFISLEALRDNKLYEKYDVALDSMAKMGKKYLDMDYIYQIMGIFNPYK